MSKGNESTIDVKALRNVLRDPKAKGFEGRQFSRYDILSEIARGGMGVVFRARHRELDHLVALKLLAQQDPSDEATARFKREGRVLAKIKHDHVVGIHDLGSENGISFLAMELVEGHTLMDELQEHKQKNTHHSFERAVEIVLAIARALEHCHEVGAVHRDVKPHNILVESPTGRPVLTDFGLVKKDPAKMGQSANISGAVSQAGKILGTPSFMSPEQFEPNGKFGKVGSKSDVYGLGAVLFTVLTGTPPFMASNVVELYGMVMDDPPPKPSEMREGVPEILDVLVADCLEKKVEDRLTMAELRQRLEAISQNSKLLAPPSSAGLKHALIIIAVFAVMALIHVSVIQPEIGKRIWRVLVGGSEESKTPEPAKTVSKTAGPKAPQGEGDPEELFKQARKLISAKQDLPEAARLLRRAAKRDHVSAMVWLGRLNYEGRGIRKDEAKAKVWFEKAATKGSVTAMLWLGNLLKGDDPRAALAWYRKASETAKSPKAKADAQQAADALLKAHPELGQ